MGRIWEEYYLVVALVGMKGVTDRVLVNPMENVRSVMRSFVCY